jgi:hypothetical protein
MLGAKDPEHSLTEPPDTCFTADSSITMFIHDARASYVAAQCILA